MVCRLVTRTDRLRPRVERHVRQVYASAHDATIRAFPDLMVADFDDAQAVRCAAGLRRAADGFFSECYLNRAFEDVLSELAAAPVGRARIIEVTSLASGSACALSRLIACIVEHARGQGVDWAVFTITPRLERRLRQLKLPLIPICPAEPSRVAHPEDWGRYYEAGPMVMALPDRGLPSTLGAPDHRTIARSRPGSPRTGSCARLAHVV